MPILGSVENCGGLCALGRHDGPHKTVEEGEAAGDGSAEKYEETTKGEDDASKGVGEEDDSSSGEQAKGEGFPESGRRTRPPRPSCDNPDGAEYIIGEKEEERRDGEEEERRDEKGEGEGVLRSPLFELSILVSLCSCRNILGIFNWYVN